MTAKGYIFAELDVHDATIFYDEYMAEVRPILEDYGAVFLAATNDPEVIEGDRKVKRIILLEFDSMDRAREFFYSEAYQNILHLRLNSSSAHLYFFEGLPKK